MSQPAPVTETERAQQTSARENLRDIYLTAGKAFELIDRHQTPPDPQTYAMWYAYASGQNPRLSEQVDAALRAKGRLGPFEIEAICQDLLAEIPADTAQRDIGIAIEREIESALQIIRQGAESNRDYSETLKQAGAELPANVTGADVSALVARLLEENLRMSQTTQELSAGLQDSQNQIALLNKQLEEAQAQCALDPLTGTANRRAFDKRLAEEMEAADKTGDSLCLVMADIDHFKRVNDTYGHLVGDTVLKGFATIISNNIKGKDMIARLGGEEFAIILPQTETIPAYNFLVKIKHYIRDTRFPLRDAKDTHARITASFGIAAYTPGMTAEEFVAAADEWLYKAKTTGRDRICCKGL